MSQAFIIVLREGFEAFLIVAITFAYLKRTGRHNLMSAVYFGAATSLVTSAGLGFLLWQGVNTPLWEGLLGLVSAGLIAGVVFHMWRTAIHLKKNMEALLDVKAQQSSFRMAWLGIFIFTVLMISREGMETALLLIQIHDSQILSGVFLGFFAAAMISFLWVRYGDLMDLPRFFQVTSIFLLVFVIQILIYSFHELTEAGLWPWLDTWHEATESFSADGRYGKWFSVITITVCALWPIGCWFQSKLASSGKTR